MKVCTVCGVEYPDDVLFCQRDGTPLRSADPTKDLVGTVIADRYHIQKKLGEGGMGQVYLAEHVKMGRRCAIKIMSAGMINDPDAVSRFNREAANASRISHPNVCAIYDFGETKDGLIYLAMEFIEGRSLSDLLHETGPLPVPRAARILSQCGDALQAAHELGIVHRDLKPDNIMVITSRAKDTVKVVDFGIAKATGADTGGQKVTRTGLVVGTPEYMSPEQLSGDQLDGRSDQYSLALVFYRMITGSLPFKADSAQETMVKRLTDDPAPLIQAKPDGHFPSGLQAIMDKALARWPSDRFASAAEFAKDVANVTAGMTASVDTEGATQVVKAGGESKGQIPATRVDPSVPRSRPTQQPTTPARAAPAVSASGTSKARRGFPILPVAAGAVLLALGGGAYAARGMLFGPSSGTTTPAPGKTTTESTTTKPPEGAGGLDTTKHVVVAGGGTRTDTASTRVVKPPPPKRDTTTRPPGGTTTRVAEPDTIALRAELDAIFDDIAVAGKRTAARQRAEQIFGMSKLPVGLKAEAAQLVGQGYLEDAQYPQARDWYGRALALQPKASWQSIYDKIPH